MKKLSIKKGVQCMACLECVRACSNAYYKEFHPDKAAPVSYTHLTLPTN